MTADAEDERLTEEWKRWQEIVSHTLDPRSEFRHALRWTLVSVFGHWERFHLDPQFRAQVHAAESMIYELYRLAHKNDLLDDE